MGVLDFRDSAGQPISAGKWTVLQLLGQAKDDPEMAARLPDPDVVAAFQQEGLSFAASLDVLLRGYADRPALGERAYRVEDGERVHEAAFKTTTYGELHERARRIADSFRNGTVPVGTDDFVCIIGFASVDYVAVEIACAYANAAPVPLQLELGRDHLRDIFANVEPAAVFATVADAEGVAELLDAAPGDVPLIVMDFDAAVTGEADVVARLRAKLGKRLATIDEVLAAGTGFESVTPQPHPAGDDRTAGLIHSSGSTGQPKGAMMPERAVKMRWQGARTHVPVVTVNLGPLNHIIGRNTVANALSRGGTCYFTLKPDLSTLFEDIRLARPTTLAFFPRVLELIYQHYQREVAKNGRSESDVRAEMGASYLGDRLVIGTVGGAPVTDKVLDFMRETFGMVLHNVYGSTESGSGGIVFNGRVRRPPVTEYRLRDVPELGYYTTDKPFPRGEFCFKAIGTVTKYYKQPDATDGLFDEDGFQCTGDIVEERAPDHILIIDRRKDVLKLSQGEYVAVGPLGAIFEAGSPVIAQSYLYGNSFRSYLVAVIVPDMDAVTTMIGEGASEAALRTLIRDELLRVGRERDLKSFEIPRDFIVEHEPFSQANGLLSSVRKRLRPKLRETYGEALEALYARDDALNDAALAELKSADCTLDTAGKIARLIELQLGAENADPSSPRTFTEWGGDSLGAVSFDLALEDVFGVGLSANTVLSPAGNIAVWAKAFDAARDGTVTDRFKAVHGNAPAVLRADDLTLDAFLPDALLADAPALPLASDGDVLVTGANGFLGRFVLLELLQAGGRVVCLVRGADDAAARARLQSVFEEDVELAAAFAAVSDKLDVIAGDLASPRFGLDEAAFEALAGRSSRIVHVGALVNHKLPYRALFDANVAGTAEVIRLALTTTRKPVDFVSTVAVEAFLADGELAPTATLSERYAAGYGASKWAAEHLLHRAQELAGMSLNVLRGDMMLAHQRYAGQVNADDMFTRLVSSIIQTGVAPESFYAAGEGTPSSYPGVPVDAVARAVTGAGRGDAAQTITARGGVVGSASLDDVVDAVESAGYPVERMPHADWVEAITTRLGAMAEGKRAASVLPLMDAFSKPYPRRAHWRADPAFAAALPEGVPVLDDAYLGKCIADMKARGLV